MADEIDRSQRDVEQLEEARIALIREAAAKIAPGKAGDCIRCGEHFARIVRGHCARCRDTLRLP